MKTKLISVFIAMAVFFVISSCNKSDSGSTKTIPDKFVDLKIDPNFDFDSFKNLSTSIKIPVNKQTSTTIVQIFNANPASGGRLILTGSLNQNNEFHSEMRIPAYLTEVYVGKVSSDGLNEYVAVPVTDGALDFTFGQKEAKSVTAVLGNDCGDGSCTTTVSGTQSNKTIQSGEYWCVAEGTNAVFNDLEIKSGGTLRICGTATINSVDNDGGEGSLIVTPLGTLTMAKHDNEMDIENYGILNVSGGGGSDFKIKGTLQNWGTMTISRKFENE